jgi:FkbM family methyltransferase
MERLSMWRTNLLKSVYKLNSYLNHIWGGQFRFVRISKHKIHKVMLRWLTLKNNTMLVKFGGIYLYINANSDSSSAYIFKPFEEYTRNLFKNTIIPGSIVLDIGAQFGLFSLIAAQQLGNKGKVYAFEPVSSNYKILKRNIRLNQYANVIQAVPKAVGNKPGAVQFFVYKESDSHAMYQHPTAKVKEIISIECITIDEFIEGQSVHVIKMDIEGNEPYALEGMAKTILKSDNLTLFTEYAPDYLRRAGVEPDQYLNQLQNLGFEVQVIDEESRCLQPLSMKDALISRDFYKRVNLYCTKENRT